MPYAAYLDQRNYNLQKENSTLQVSQHGLVIFSGGHSNVTFQDINKGEIDREEVDLGLTNQTPSCYDFAPLLSNQGSNEFKD
jgi:hypothetical protein